MKHEFAFLTPEQLARPLPISIGLSGGSGPGKTYSAPRVARGIAEELNVQPATVYTHVRNTVQKLGVDTQTQAVALALRYSFLHDA